LPASLEFFGIAGGTDDPLAVVFAAIFAGWGSIAV